MREIQFLGHRHEISQVSEFHRLTIVETYGWTKKQSIGRMCRRDVQTILVMDDTQINVESGLQAATQTTSTDARNSNDSFGPSVDSFNGLPLDQHARSESPATQSAPALRAKKFRAITGALTLIILLVSVATYIAKMHSLVKTDNAYLAAHIHTISSRVAGTIAEVLICENQTVSKGAVLARLDPRDFEVRRGQALAQLASARAQVTGAGARIEQVRAQTAREQARATKARNDLARASSLFEGGSGAISKQELDLARADADAAQASLQEAQSALDSANAAKAAARAQEQAAAAGLQDAELQLSYTEITAPAAGRIGKKGVEVGNHVQPGQALLALVQPDIWVTANFKETQLSRLKPGQKVVVRVDAFPGRTFRGTIESLSPASGAEFALLPPDNATGNFTKIVQRVPVKVTLDDTSLGDCVGRLVAGMSALVEVNVHD